MTQKIDIIELPTESSALINKQSQVAPPFSYLFSSIDSGKIYTKRTNGRYKQLRRKVNFFLMGAFFLLPWLEIDGRQSVLFDLNLQRFDIFYSTFFPSDGGLLAQLLLLAALLLVASTIMVGRAWCGFICPQTVWTFIFMWLEDKCEGDRSQRIKLDNERMSIKKFIRKGGKHILWLLVSLITAYTFVGYFYDIKELIEHTFVFGVHYLAVFWLAFFIVMTYLNSGWLREKVCLHMCPYARFQAVMYAKDTRVVTYNSTRGENRGKRKMLAKGADKTQGDCVDCGLCVTVCPVDIDIRNGLQYPCINCGLCVDACNSVMKKIGLEANLINFSAIDNKLTVNDSSLSVSKFKSIPAIFLFFISISCIACVLFALNIIARPDLSIDIMRERGGQLFHLKEGGVENIYTIKVKNLSATENAFNFKVKSQSGLRITSEKSFKLSRGSETNMILSVWGNKVSSNHYKETIFFELTSKSGAFSIREKSSFFTPQ